MAAAYKQLPVYTHAGFITIYLFLVHMHLQSYSVASLSYNIIPKKQYNILTLCKTYYQRP